ncbi:MAG: hypothetical protein H7A49_14180 [Akkermansiaceae bacterium]|nr:hypothetical protein [Akkermansiaceae bacterium]MCP5545041.1 hypothetical protein [Akkermansiaceae bacterium]MCP5546239.1 hypothetical protein [Akkermansiaceae bacterium]
MRGVADLLQPAARAGTLGRPDSAAGFFDESRLENPSRNNGAAAGEPVPAT